MSDKKKEISFESGVILNCSDRYTSQHSFLEFSSPVSDSESLLASFSTMKKNSNGKAVDNQQPVVIPSSKPSVISKKPLIKIIKQLLQISDGRDKSLKIIQYTLKILLILHKRHGFKISRPLERILLPSPLSATTVSKVDKIVSSLSTTRKIIRVGHWIESIIQLQDSIAEKETRNLVAYLVFNGLFRTSQSQRSIPIWDYENIMRMLTMIGAVLGIFSDICDDVVCLGKLGIVTRKSVLNRAEILGCRFWFIGIFIDLYEQVGALSQIRSKILQGQKDPIPQSDMVKLREKQFAATISSCKLIGDFTFCLFDVFSETRLDKMSMNGLVPTLSALFSGSLAAYKLFAKCC